MSKVIGIDLGTTNSVVAFMEGGRPEVIPNAEGAKTTPSIVLFQKDANAVVGELAKRQRLTEPTRAIHSVKRFVGCRWDESEQRREGIHYELVEGPEGLVNVKIGEELKLPETVQAETLRKMKQTAEDFLGEEVFQAVITCPAYFNDSQRSATKKAAELAGLEALRIINEPTAAALAYGIDKRKSARVAVFDFGGGTFDISILEIDDDVFEVKASCGDTFLGGDTIDHALASWIIERVLEENDLDLSDDSQAMSRISETAEQVKCELSTLPQTTVALPFLAAGESGPIHFNTELSREHFDMLIEPILKRLEEPCQQALKDAGLSVDELDEVILVGGSTRIPAVQALVQKLFKRAPNKSINPDEAVAVGAAIQAGIMSGDLDEILLLDVTPLSLGIELAGGIFSPLIQRNSNIPTTARKNFTTVRDNQTAVKVHVLQGERRMARENRTLSRFSLEGISPAPREVPEIEVTFTIDANGILNVTAMDLTTGALQQVKVESYEAARDTETDKMIEEAEAHKKDDNLFMRKAMVRRQLEEVRQEFDHYMKRSDTQISEERERSIRESIFRLEVALTQRDFDPINEAMRDLKALYNDVILGEADKVIQESPEGLNLEAIELDLESGSPPDAPTPKDE